MKEKHSSELHHLQRVEVIEEVIGYLTGREAQLRSETEAEEALGMSHMLRLSVGRLCECSEILEALRNGDF